MISLPLLDPVRIDVFPPVAGALDEPDGLLAVGGDLSPARLLAAYRRGIFPWYSAGEPILWWSPARRAVFDTARPHVPRRLARWLRHCDWQIRVDTAFAQVLERCAAPRRGAAGTWLGPDMQRAYRRLHALGHAHSVEAWDGERLVGGIYGLAIGRMFFGESMFSAADNGSKLALLALCRILHQCGFPLLDAQMWTPHLARFGVRELPREAFCREAARLAGREQSGSGWPARIAIPHPTELVA